MDFEAAWERKGLQIEASLDEAVAVTADRELLSLVWNNLISNAVKFTGPGGHIRVDLEEEGIGAVVTVSDTGCGISPEVGPHIFEKFYQGDNSRKAEGNGLGLSLVKRIVELCNGTVSVQSMPGQGAAFSVTLPL